MYSWEKYGCAVIVSVSFSELIERANCIHVPLKIFDKRFAWKKGAWILKYFSLGTRYLQILLPSSYNYRS